MKQRIIFLWIVTIMAIASLVGTTRPTFRWQEIHEPYLPPIQIVHATNT